MPEGLALLLERGLDKDPASRPTAAEVLAVLDGAGAARLPEARRGRQGARRVTVGAAVLALAGVAWWLAGRGREEPAPAAPQAASPSLVTPPTRPEAPPTPSPSAAAAPSVASPVPPAVAPALSASLQGEVLALRNGGATRLEDLVVSLAGADGNRHVARVPEGLGPGEELFVALEDFSPPAAADAVRSGSEVHVREGSGARRAVVVHLR